MKNLIPGIIGIALGALILYGYLVWGGPQGAGAFQTGQTAGLVFGLLLLLAGIFYLVRGFQMMGQPPRGKKRPKKRSRGEK
jgi:hypothetical protein